MNKTAKQFKSFWVALFVVGGFLLFNVVHAQVNQSLNFTGKVTETDGSELADGVYDFSFALYTVPTGGAAIWTETLSATSSFSATIASGVAGANTTVYSYAGESATTSLRVGQYLSNASGDSALIANFDTSTDTITVVGTDVWADATAINNRPFVEGGVIDVDLGAVTNFSGVNFDQTLYLEVTFNAEIMRPRKTINSVAQAFNADTLDGLHSSDFANLSDNSTVTGEWTFSNIVNMATSSAQTVLTVNQDGSGDIVDFQLSGATAFAVLNDGRVQIGDYYFPASHGSAGYVLKTNVAGVLYWDADIAGSGGGSGYWATSTDSSFVYQSDTGRLIVLGNNATSAPVTAQFEVEGLSWFDDIAVSNQQLLRLYDSDSSNYMAIRASTSLASNFILTLPSGVGASGEALLTDGNGNLSWGAPSLGGALNDLDNVDTGTPNNGDLLFYNINTWDNIATSGLNINSDDLVEGSSNLFLVGNEITLADLSTPDSDGLDYSSANGQFTLTSGYIIPLSASTSNWQTSYTLVNANNANWTSAYGWGNHDAQNYFDLDDAALPVNEGGTGKISYSQYSIPYMTDATTFGEIAIGSSTYVLSVNAGGNGYEWIEASSTGVVLTQEQVDDYVEALINDLDSNHSLISINYDDADNAMDFVVDGDLANYDNSNSAFFSTTTDTLAVNYGGTGRTSWTQYSIPYMTSSNAYGEVAIGTSTYILSVNSGGDGYEWIEASSTGVVLTQEEVDDYSNALLRDSDSVHSRITITYDDTDNAMDFVVDADLANYDNSNSAFFSTTTDILAANYGGTGQDSNAWTGFTYVSGGTWSASNTISATRLDSIVMLAGEGNLLLTNTASYITDGNTGWDNSYNFITLTNLSASLPLSYNNGSGAFSISQSDSGTDGYLSSGDWTTFNAKQDTLTLGNLTENNSTLLTIVGGTNATVGNVTIEVNDDLSNYDNTTTAFIARGGITAASPVAYDSGTGIISLGVVGVANGGTGTTTYEANSIVYASAINTIGEILAGTNGEVLKMVAGVPTWGEDYGGSAQVWASSSDQLMIHPNPDTQVVLIGASATSSAGFIFEVAGNSLFGGSISAQDLSLINAMNVASGGTGSSSPNGLLYGDGMGNIVSVNNNSADWNTAYSWGDHSTANYFSTTTDTLDIAYGGTGRTTWTANSIVYANAVDSLGQIAAGGEGEALVMQGGVPTWSATAPGTPHSLLSALHSGTEATSTQERGDFLTVNSSNNYTRLALGASGYILRSNGLDASWVPTINITELGTITTGTWNGDAIGIAFGGTGSTTAAGARTNLDLDDIYDYAINSTATSGWVWMSDGAGRGEWIASTTLMAAAASGDNVSKFIGTTTALTNGLFATGTLQGYAAANDICNAEFSGSHFCRTYDILVTVEQDDLTSWGTANADAWIAEGPPGFTANSNDCNGWNEGGIDYLGAFWVFNSDTGGYGKLVNCTQIKSIACCIR